MSSIELYQKPHCFLSIMNLESKVPQVLKFRWNCKYCCLGIKVFSNLRISLALKYLMDWWCCRILHIGMRFGPQFSKTQHCLKPQEHFHKWTKANLLRFLHDLIKPNSHFLILFFFCIHSTQEKWFCPFHSSTLNL